ncbi:Uncharacterized protein APZ42_012262 [Daphnia magna]|uniref:Uncharacterized protein n=1 Tax=Daphnia magna TaxID=35525 RepID=A0A162CN72_9CRUS|nr:Uncharacterized protein APZ42_012262 [Daphnia magna]
MFSHALGVDPAGAFGGHRTSAMLIVFYFCPPFITVILRRYFQEKIHNAT